MYRLLMNTKLVVFLCALFMLPMVQAIHADNTKEYKLHTVHYNAFPSDSLPQEMTNRYQLKRSKNVALVNISVVKNQPSIPIQGVKSIVTGEIKNLMAQKKELVFQEIHEGEAYYYIAQVPVDHNEVVKFNIQVKTGDKQNYQLSFDKQFGTR